jgi:hypothetical protein
MGRVMDKMLPARPAKKVDPRIAELERENRVLRLQNTRLAAERVMLQEIARAYQNQIQNMSIMVGDVINHSSGLLTDEGVKESMQLLADSTRSVRPSLVEDVIQRIALTDPRTQGVIAAPERQLAHGARVVNDGDTHNAR